MLQVFDREHIGRRLRHRDDVRTERRGGDRGHDLERLEHVADLVSGPVGEIPRNRRAVGDRASEVTLPLFFRPFEIGPVPAGADDRVERCRVTLRVLADVEPDDR